MVTVRRGQERGHMDYGWLDTYHTFSFGEYRDPRHMGYRSLRVINEDRVGPGRGFGAHGHRDMEIVTYVLEGALEHQDSMGNRRTLSAGEAQRISAGRGIVHSEYNASNAAPVHFLQIWIEPASAGAAPSYEERRIELAEGAWTTIASSNPADGCMALGQDAAIRITRLSAGATARHALAQGRGAWLHVVRGAASAHGHALMAGDAIAVEGEAEVAVTAGDAGAEVLLFDLA